tara:strand:- start:5661 stop:5858 length:198 start_codon:yes stop_codon:yes gene_type:complete
MKIIDSNDNSFICRIGSPLIGIKLKKIYVWDEEIETIDWDAYVESIKGKFIDSINIKVNKRFKKV